MAAKWRSATVGSWIPLRSRRREPSPPGRFSPLPDREAPPEDQLDPDPVAEPDPGPEGDPPEQAPGSAFLDYQCGGKHRRHAISSFTDNGAHFFRSGGTEVFQHLDTSCNRVEVDTNTHYKTGVTLATGIANEFVRVRIVHNVNASKLDIFINGKNEFSGSGGKGGSFNLKYGNYGTGAPTKVTWRNVSW